MGTFGGADSGTWHDALRTTVEQLSDHLRGVGIPFVFESRIGEIEPPASAMGST